MRQPDVWRDGPWPKPGTPATGLDVPRPGHIGDRIRFEFKSPNVAVLGWGYRDGTLTFEIGENPEMLK